MFRRKLLKRVLPVILSVAMVLETVPATALAAEYGESEAVEEIVPEEAEANYENDAQNETGNVSEDINTTVDEDTTAKERLGETSENKTQTADIDGNDDNEELAAKDEENAAAALDTKIGVDEKMLANDCSSSSSYKYDVDKKVILVKYDEQNSDPFGSLLTRIKSNYISVEVDGTTNNTLIESLNYQWQKADGTSLAADAVPTDAGDYMLVVSLDAVDSVCSKAEIKIPFTISKRQLFIALSDAYVVPGTTVGTLKAKLDYALNKETTDWNTERTEDITEAKESYIDTLSLAVYNAYQTETVLADDVKLLEGIDYVVSVRAALKQTVSSNYAISEETVLRLKSYERIETWIEAVQKMSEELITNVYDETKEKQISYETEIKDKLTVTVKVYDPETNENIVLDEAVVTEVWFDAAKQELGEGAEFEPKAAGTYYLGFRYYPTEEDANIYEVCEDSDFIRIVIERAPLTFVPVFQADAPEIFYTGMTEADVLKYADYKLLNAGNEEVAIDRDTFWGVSYDDVNNSTTNTRQSYEPVFRLIRAEKDANGNPVKDEITGKEVWTENDNNLLDASKYCYRLVFTGKKAVYTKTGALGTLKGKEISVNGSDVDAEDKNHSIVTTPEALLANYAEVSVAEAKKTTIDVSGILQENFNTTNLNDLYSPTKLVSKVYDGEALYAPSRGEYKKAVVTAEDGEEAAKNYDAAITYKWYQINRVQAVYDETDPENPNQTGWEVAQKTQVGGASNSIPTAAGEYMLEIRFAKTGYVSCTETIYYRVDKQLLIVDIEAIPEAFKNQSVSSYTSDVHYEGDYNVYVVPDNQYSETVKTAENLLKDWYKIPFSYDLNDYPYGYYYKLNWYVEQVERDEDNNPVIDENGNVVYTELDSYDELSVSGADTYRLGVRLETRNSNYTNYEIIYDVGKKPTPAYTTKSYNDIVNITVSEKEAGTTPITIELDVEKLITTKDYDGKPFYASEDEGWKSIQNALTIKNAETGETIAKDKWPFIQPDILDQEMHSSIAFDKMIYGGSYTLSLYALSDETYQFAYLDNAAEYTINKIALTVTPSLIEDIPAGTYAGSSNDGVIYNLSKTEFAGYAEADAEAFQYGASVYIGDTKTLGFGAYAYVEDKEPYYNTLSAAVSKAGDANRYYGYIKYGKEYAVQFAGELAYPYSRNYDVEYARKTFQATRRGNASVDSNAFPKNYLNYCFVKTDLAQRNEGTTVTITPVRPIPYIKAPTLSYTDAFGNVIQKEGNYFEFEIQAPKEFFEDSNDCGKYRDGFIYRSSIEAAGGYVLETFEDKTTGYSNTNECIVVFPVEEKAVKKFEIIWETGYTEQFVIDFTNAVLEEDLAKAVAPKSLAFNGVNTKMAVGDEQQLDVKIKKVQISDIIYIDYQVTQGSDVISVTTDDSKGASGYVTALKPGKATVAAVPVRLVNGVKTKIEGAKEAKVSITVSDVTAPAIKKVAATDKKVTFTYLKPTNGYRREVYILAGKKKAEDFETLIRSMNNGQWRGIFTVQPQYYANESVDAKKITNEMNISGLPANGEYTIYVRNVSGIRTLEDGSCVQLSAKGTVKSFKTTKPQVEALRLYAENDAGSFVTTKNVKLTDKTEQLYTLGQFSTIDIDPAADAADKSWLTLPLDKAYSKTFVAPKLVYGVTSDLDWVDVSDIRDFRNYTYISGRYYKKTDIATVDKKGKVTFKGVGKVYVFVYDQTTDPQLTNPRYVTLNIYANADSIKAKDAKLAVGKRVYLSSLLTYYEGKTVISGMDYQNTGIIGTSYKPNLTIPAETVSKINSEGNFVIAYTGDGDYSITALKPNAVCEITAKDGTLPVSLKIQSTPIEPVKELKVTDMVDNGFLIGISFSVDTDPMTWHRIDITDERGNVIASEHWGSTAANTGYDGKKKVYTQVFEDDVHKQDKWRYTSSKITRLSKYNVSVTTVIGDETSAKPVTKSVKTTDFPASHWDIPVNEYNGITVTAYGWAGTEKNSFSLSTRQYLTSGNAYTLRAEVDASAQYRMTDTLTWRSTNTKVASVKAKAGTYTAQLNALMPGSTVIEVTSKITKKVIARWPVFVKAVGNAKDCYYGDYEYTGEYVYTYDPNYTGNVEVLTLQNAVRVTSSEIYDEYTNSSITSSNYKWVKFTAPAFGRYSFNCSRSVLDMVSSLKGNSGSYPGNSSAITMAEGETLYFRVQGTFTMSVSDYVKQGTSFTVDDGSVLIDDDSKQLIAFRSTQDNVYTFYSKELPSLSMKIYNEQLSTQTSITRTDNEGLRKYDVSLSMGEIIYLEVPAGNYSIYAEKREADALGDSAALSLTDTVNGQWYIYTASASGLYTFKSKDATSALTIAYYKSLKDFDPTAWSITTDGNDFSGRMTLKEGDKVVFNIRAIEAATATIIVTPEIPENLAVGEEKELPVNADSRRWVAFQLPEAGRYRFSAVSTEEGAAYDVNLRYFKNAIEENEITTIEKNEIIVSDIEFSNANNIPDTAVGDTVYVEITTTKEGAEAANVKVSLTQVTATELTVGEAQTITVKNGEARWYTFTAPETKKYIVQSVVTPNTADDGTVTDTHKLTAGYYLNGLEQRTQTHSLNAIGEYDFYREYPSKIDSTYTFKVSVDDLGLGTDGTEITTTAKIIVKELTATPLEMDKTEEISLLKNERKWYSFTAPETDLYIFESKAIEGRFSLLYGDSIDSTSGGRNINNGYDGVELEKGQTIYIETRAFQGVAAKFTLLVRLPNKLSGTVEEQVTVTSETPAYYMYTADAYTRYAISYTVDTPDAEANVYYDTSVTVTSTNRIRNHYIDLPLEENEVRHIKVDTTSGTEVTVTLRIEPIDPIKLSVGTTEVSVRACGEEPTLDNKYTWCSFTAEKTGRYTIAKTNSDASIMEFYDNITDSKKNENFNKNYYEAGETVYVALYTEKDQDLQTSVEVGMIQIVPVEGESVDESITSDNRKEYSYTAQKTGLYTFTNESDAPAQLYMDITDDESVSVASQELKTIFLKENDIMYISATSSTGYPIRAKFTIALAGEPQTLLKENEPTPIAYDGQDAKLIAFTAEEAALYNFDIVYSEGNNVGYNKYVYYMNQSQILWENNALYSRQEGGLGENEGKHKVYARMIFEGETGYLYIPWFNSEATIEVSRFAEEPIVETLKVNEPTAHAFKMEEKEETDEDGNVTKTQVGERVYYVFDAPEDNDYTLTFDREGMFVQYEVKYYQHGLNALSSGSTFNKYINSSQSFDISGIKKKQRVCLVITKKQGSLDAQKLTVTVTKKQ